MGASMGSYMGWTKVSNRRRTSAELLEDGFDRPPALVQTAVGSSEFQKLLLSVRRPVRNCRRA
jgi:hypothetical protein